jgi:hypothetical protein
LEVKFAAFFSPFFGIFLPTSGPPYYGLLTVCGSDGSGISCGSGFHLSRDRFDEFHLALSGRLWFMGSFYLWWVPSSSRRFTSGSVINSGHFIVRHSPVMDGYFPGDGCGRCSLDP